MSWWARLLRLVRSGARRILNILRAAAAQIGQTLSHTRSSVLAATRRHRDRVQDDSMYARSISTAVAELVTTMVPRSTLATTLAVALSGLLSHDHPDTPRQPSPRPRDGYSPYSSYGEQLPPTTPGSLWDRLT